MQEGADQNDKPVGLEVLGTSSEDEKKVNSNKLKDLFLANLKAMREQEAFEQWQLQISEDQKLIELKKGDNAVTFHYQADGFHLSLNEVNDESTDLMMHTLAAYQSAYNQVHPKTNISFELICNDEEEAKKIIKQALKMNPPLAISELKFYPDEPGKALESKKELLERIYEECTNKSKPKRSSRS